MAEEEATLIERTMRNHAILQVRLKSCQGTRRCHFGLFTKFQNGGQNEAHYYKIRPVLAASGAFQSLPQYVWGFFQAIGYNINFQGEQ